MGHRVPCSIADWLTNKYFRLACPSKLGYLLRFVLLIGPPEGTRLAYWRPAEGELGLAMRRGQRYRAVPIRGDCS